MSDIKSIDIPRAKQLLDYDESTGTLRASEEGAKIVRKWKPGKEVGTVNRNGYRIIMLDGKLYQAHRLVWALHYGEQPPPLLDHINQNKLDNRVTNLRPADKQLNALNSKGHRDSASGVKNVRWTGRNWEVSVSIGGMVHKAGQYAAIDDAAIAAAALRESLCLP